MTRAAAIDSIKKGLLRRRDELLSRSCTTEIVAGDDAEIAFAIESNSVESVLIANTTSELNKVDAALQRIVDDNYGVCEQCGQKITVARLQALPYANLCITCQGKADG